MFRNIRETWAALFADRGAPAGARRWFVEGVNEWAQFFEDCNWYTFHPVQIEVEHDEILGGVEATVIVLGFGVRWRWNYSVTKTMEEIRRTMAAVDAGHETVRPFNMGDEE